RTRRPARTRRPTRTCRQTRACPQARCGHTARPGDAAGEVAAAGQARTREGCARTGRPARPDARAAAAQALRATGAKPVFEDSNVREVLKALGDTSATGETRLMRAPPAPRAAAPAADPSLSDTQVLKMLETRRPEGAAEAVA